MGCLEPPGAFWGLWGRLNPKKDVGCDGGAAGNGTEGLMSCGGDKKLMGRNLGARLEFLGFCSEAELNLALYNFGVFRKTPSWWCEFGGAGFRPARHADSSPPAAGAQNHQTQ